MTEDIAHGQYMLVGDFNATVQVIQLIQVHQTMQVNQQNK